MITEDNIFIKIIKGEIPCHKIYEDDYTLAFLDIYPVQPGMTLVVTKVPAETVFDLDQENYVHLWQTVKKIAERMKEVFPDKRRIGAQVEGLDVAHPHVKVFPINTGDEFRAAPDTTKEPDHAALAEMAQRLTLD
jgi:histidine triad (HIT) family protein